MADATGASATTLYVPGFRANLNLAPQQTKSRLLAYVDSDLNYSEPGQFFNGDDVGTSDPTDITTKVPDSPEGFVDLMRRFGAFKPFGDGKFIDNEDKARQLEDPTNKTMAAMLAGLGRKRDLTIINGALGTYQYQDNNGNYQTGAANANSIAANDATAHEGETISAVQNATTLGYGLTVGKLIEVKNYLDNSELDEAQPDDDSPYIFACTANQIRDLQMSIPATSSYYTAMQALVGGKLTTFMGFRFVRMPSSAISNPLPKASYTRTCLAFHPRAIQYRARPIINTEIVKRADKSFRWYAYYESDHGALRRYDGGVYSVLCDERTQAYT